MLTYRQYDWCIPSPPPTVPEMPVEKAMVYNEMRPSQDVNRIFYIISITTVI